MTVDKANAIAKLGQTIINSAKLEFDVLKMKERLGQFYPGTSGFLDSEDDDESKQIEGKKK